ncbi:MAG: hypothetical protein U0J70_03440 [Atopobiaceae bacterium]|nr:hypothetical protein [Atopobiaceae bacterium]
MASTRSRQATWTFALVMVCSASLALFGWLVVRPDDRGSPEQEQSSLTLDQERTVDKFMNMDVDGDRITGYETTQDLESTATDLLNRYYEKGEPCVVQCVGYLGLLGNAWACVIEGPGWVDICAVRQQEQGCVVRTARITPGLWKEMHGT